MESVETKPKLKVTLGSLRLSNPVMTASGTFGYGLEFADRIDLNRLGGLVVKGLSLEPRPGNPQPRLAETAAGLLNSIGLQNIGVRAFLKEKLPELAGLRCCVLANIFGESAGEYAQVARMLDGAEGLSGLEVNVSCPNVKEGGALFGTDPRKTHEVVAGVRAATAMPVVVKLSPNVTHIGEIARAAEDAGADALSVCNTFSGMAIDVQTRRPRISTVTGGLSGPAIKPLALRMVWETVSAVSIPVIGVGGIVNASDALEYIIAGAHAIQVGTANFLNPHNCIKVIDDLESYLLANDIQDINEIRGTLKVD
jgi:dihydroorotate dehydrogenase (NAD+) catalytic subunit